MTKGGKEGGNENKRRMTEPSTHQGAWAQSGRGGCDLDGVHANAELARPLAGPMYASGTGARELSVQLVVSTSLDSI
eukprot:8082085-Pyramimonas_sp.AAC.2